MDIFQPNLANWYEKYKPFGVLLKQDMMRFQWHQQVICTSLQKDNHANTSSLRYLIDTSTYLISTSMFPAEIENTLTVPLQIIQGNQD